MKSTWRLFFSVLLAASLAASLSGCSSGGGGGGGVMYDNSRANGTYTYVVTGGGGAGVEVGTITFDGAGNAVYSAITSSDSGSITYTVTTTNVMTIHDPINGTSITGSLRSGGSFFVGNDTTNGNEVMITAVKQSTAVTDATTTYYSGQLEYDTNSGFSQVGIVSLVTASPGPGILTYDNLVSLDTGTLPYLLSTVTGTISIPDPNPIVFGAISSDMDIMVFGDGETASDNQVMAGCGFKLAGSGMTNASLNGTYSMYTFRDDSGNGDFVTSRARIVLKGDSTGTFTETASSDGTIDPPSDFGYQVDPSGDGTFLVTGGTDTLYGVMLQDQSVFGLIDPNNMAVAIGVRQ